MLIQTLVYASTILFCLFSLKEVMRIIDGPIAMLPCFSLNYYHKCDECEEESCEIKALFEQFRDRTLDILNGQTIKSLTLY